MGAGEQRGVPPSNTTCAPHFTPRGLERLPDAVPAVVFPQETAKDTNKLNSVLVWELLLLRGGVLGPGRGGGDTARTAEPATQGTFHTMSHHGQCVKLEEEEVKGGNFGVLVFDPIAAWRHLGRRNSPAVNLRQKRGCSPSKAGVNSTHPSVPLISSLRVPLGAHGTSLSGCAAAGRG